MIYITCDHVSTEFQYNNCITSVIILQQESFNAIIRIIVKQGQDLNKTEQVLSLYILSYQLHCRYTTIIQLIMFKVAHQYLPYLITSSDKSGLYR